MRERHYSNNAIKSQCWRLKSISALRRRMKQVLEPSALRRVSVQRDDEDSQTHDDNIEGDQPPTKLPSSKSSVASIWAILNACLGWEPRNMGTAEFKLEV
jgi:hypothetical protein